jgi:hypothetical protein
MAVTIIENQAINFGLQSESDDCSCNKKTYCQLVNKNDIGKYQILSSTVIENGNFNDGEEGWTIIDNITSTIEIINESAEDECDGSLEVTPTSGTGPYEYSLNGATFVSSGLFENLCVGCYTIVIKDSAGAIGATSGCIVTNIVCGDYTETDELLPFTTAQLLNCLTSDFI